MQTGRRDYQERKAARIERLKAGAARKAEEAQHLRTKNDALLGAMNGTPVLRGHHSERRHRRDLARIDNDMRKGAEAAQESHDLARRAVAAESSTAVSSDDPEAIDKLRAKLTKLEQTKEEMKRANAVIRKAQRAAKGASADATHAIIEALAKEMGWSEATAAKLAEPDFAGRIGFADYQFTNSGAEARRLKTRIAEIEARAATDDREEVIGDVRIVQTNNRVQLHFPRKPDESMRSALKARGFRWSPRAEAWQRIASEGAWFSARQILASKLSS